MVNKRIKTLEELEKEIEDAYPAYMLTCGYYDLNKGYDLWPGIPVGKKNFKEAVDHPTYKGKTIRETFENALADLDNFRQIYKDAFSERENI